jgi:hypothetical protein
MLFVISIMLVGCWLMLLNARYLFSNLVLHITQLHCPVNANTITECIGNISEVFATVFAKQCDGDIGLALVAAHGL